MIAILTALAAGCEEPSHRDSVMVDEEIGAAEHGVGEDLDVRGPAPAGGVSPDAPPAVVDEPVETEPPLTAIEEQTDAVRQAADRAADQAPAP